eukprot:5531467-Karenia_brevis.AAC.1
MQEQFRNLRDGIHNKAEYLVDLGHTGDAQTYRLARQKYFAIGYLCARDPGSSERVDAFWFDVNRFYREVE